MAVTGKQDTEVRQSKTKKSKKRKSSETKDEETPDQSHSSNLSKTEKNQYEASRKKKDKERLSDLAEYHSREVVSSDTSVLDNTDTVKSDKKEKSKNLPTASVVDDSESPVIKRRKREKSVSKEESSLGVVNTDILQQAEINLGLPMVDNLENASNSDEISVKKKKKKKKKDKMPTDKQPVDADVSSRSDRSIEYLRLWGSKREAWKFNKMLQVQLLHNMYDKSLISDEDFETLLLYLDGLKGKGREKTKEDAKKILDEGETEGAVDADKEERARQIFQMLS